MRKIYSYEENKKRFIGGANHQYIPWAEPPYKIVFKNCTKYDLRIVRQYVFMPEVRLNAGEIKNFPINEVCSRFLVDTPNGTFWCEERGGVIATRELRQGFLKEDVVPIWNNGVIEFRHMPKKWTLQKRSIRPVQNPAYQIKVRNWTPYDILIWLDDDIIDIVKSRCINTVFLPSGNHMLHFDTKEEEYGCHDEYFGDFIGSINGCQMGIIEDFLNIEPSWAEILKRKLSYSGWYKIEKVSNFKKRMFFWEHFEGPALEEPFIKNLYSHYDTSKKEVEIRCNTIDYRLI